MPTNHLDNFYLDFVVNHEQKMGGFSESKF